MTRILTGSLIILMLYLQPLTARAEKEGLKVFLTSCGYGTAAGALLGVASLAFESDPGSKLNNVARGASLGLYAGMGLGFYQVFGKNTDDLHGEIKAPRLLVVPVLKKNQLDGLEIAYELTRF